MQSDVGPNQYRCGQCGGVFDKGWSDEDALAEANELWGDDLGEDPAVVCDVCFQAMTSEMPIADYRASLREDHGDS